MSRAAKTSASGGTAALIAAADQFDWDDSQLETVRARGLEILGTDPHPRLDTPDRWRALLSPGN